MRRLSLTIALGAAAMASSADAQDPSRPSQALYLNGKAPAACVISGAAAVGGNNAVFSSLNATSGQILITQLVNQQTAEPQGSDIVIRLPVTCNAAHRLTISSTQGGLLRAGGQRALQGGFSEYLRYSIAVDWAGMQVQRASGNGAITLTPDNGVVGDLGIHVTTPEGGNPLVAGQYDDSIVIQFEPAT